MYYKIAVIIADENDFKPIYEYNSALIPNVGDDFDFMYVHDRDTQSINYRKQTHGFIDLVTDDHKSELYEVIGRTLYPPTYNVTILLQKYELDEDGNVIYNEE